MDSQPGNAWASVALSFSDDAAPGTGLPEGAAVPVLVSGKTPGALQAQARQILSFAERDAELTPADLAFSLATSRSSFESRAR